MALLNQGFTWENITGNKEIYNKDLEKIIVYLNNRNKQVMQHGKTQEIKQGRITKKITRI